VRCDPTCSLHAPPGPTYQTRQQDTQVTGTAASRMLRVSGSCCAQPRRCCTGAGNCPRRTSASEFDRTIETSLMFPKSPPRCAEMRRGAQSNALHRMSDPSQLVPGGLDPKVVAVYHGVGTLLSRYTTGKIPKAFKVGVDAQLRCGSAP